MPCRWLHPLILHRDTTTGPIITKMLLLQFSGECSWASSRDVTDTAPQKRERGKKEDEIPNLEGRAALYLQFHKPLRIFALSAWQRLSLTAFSNQQPPWFQCLLASSPRAGHSWSTLHERALQEPGLHSSPNLYPEPFLYSSQCTPSGWSRIHSEAADTWAVPRQSLASVESCQSETLQGTRVER